jgi:hypothetical protein
MPFFKSHFRLVSESGGLRWHPLVTPLPVVAFTSFNSILCPRGMIFVDVSRALVISHVDDRNRVSWDACRPFHKVAIRDTVRLLGRHDPSRALVLACMREVPALAADETTSRSLPITRPRVRGHFAVVRSCILSSHIFLFL